MIGKTDVNDRLPRFREALDSIADMDSRGGFEGVSPRVLEYLKAGEPVGLGEYGQVQLPDDHDSRTTPAILMLRSDEYDRRILHRETERERQAADAIIRQTGENVPVLPGMLSMGSSLPAEFAACVLTTPVPVIPRRRRRMPFAIAVPRVVVMKDEDMLPAADLGTILAHEADHWDFCINEMGLLQNEAPHPQYTWLQRLATAEKRAYLQTSRQIEKNLGRYATLQPEDLAAVHKGIPTTEAHRLLRVDKRTAPMFPDGRIPVSLAVGAASLLFGRTDEAVATRQETHALLMMGIIQSPYGTADVSDSDELQAA